MVAVVVMVVVMVAKVDKGERVVQWKGPLIGVRWHVGGRRAARAAEGGGRGAQDPAEGRELLQERRVKEGLRSRGSEWGGGRGGQQQRGRGGRPVGRAVGRAGGRAASGASSERQRQATKASGNSACSG